MLNKNKKRGFSLIELMVAIFFVSVALPGILLAISKTIAGTEDSTLRLRAIYLAQEGIEIVRNIRDTEWLKGATSTALETAGNYEADYESVSLSPFSSRFLKIDNDGFYQYSTGATTPFKRKITIDKTDDLDGDGEADRERVTVEVSWTKRGTHSVKVQEYLYDRWGY
ncbi:prepilin-type N-terminal cleavage/methylation domain-containing protein [bacterium]|nr:prepilin-type N-terminal cleavage/methylation domain-containing protein [bacterium]